MSKYFVLAHENARQSAVYAVSKAPDGMVVTIKEPTRTLDQNAAQWPYLEAWAQGKEARINGMMQKVTSDDWKDILTGAYNGEMRIAEFDGKVIMLPMRTSKMEKKPFIDWMEYLISATALAGLEPIYKAGK